MSTLYLRTNENDTLVDIDFSYKNNIVTDLSSVVIIPTYSKLLLDNLNEFEYLIYNFEQLQELRGWLFEYYFLFVNREPTLLDVMEQIKNDYEDLRNKFSLIWVTD